MAIFSAAIRSGALALLALAFTGGSASANEAPRHSYTIRASLTPSAGQSMPASGNGLQLTGTLRNSHYVIPLQSGGGIDLIARLGYSPTVCYGDTIFRDGFDP